MTILFVITANLSVVERAEADLAKKMNAPVSAGTKRKTATVSRAGKRASENEVAKALGERKKLSTEQSAARKQALAAKSKRDKIVSQVIAKEDDELLAPANGAKRNLNFDNSTKNNNGMHPISRFCVLVLILVIVSFRMFSGGIEMLSDEDEHDDDEDVDEVSNALQSADQIDILDDSESDEETSAQEASSAQAEPSLSSFSKF